MSNKTPRKSNYTKSVGTAMLTVWLNTLTLMAKVEDKVWMRLANMINEKSRVVSYTVLNHFRTLDSTLKLKTKIEDMANGNHDMHWMSNNQDIVNLFMALASEQTINVGSYWQPRKAIEVNTEWYSNPAFRYLDHSHPLNQPATAEDYDYQ